MKDLIAFLRKFRVFMLFAVLQIVAIYLYVDSYDTPKVKFLSSANSVSGAFLKKSNELTQFLNTPRANRILQEENRKLREEVDRLKEILDTVHFRDTLFGESKLHYLPAQVIYSTVNKRNNFITINRGSSDGVREGMGVFSDKSIVGVVHSVTANYSIIKSVLSSKIYIDVKVQKSGAYGLLNWDGKNPRYGEIDGISSDITLKKWQRIVTRGSSGVFPEGLYVGKIAGFKRDAAKSMWNIELWYEEDFRKLSNVYVIKNDHKKEFIKLDESLSEELKQE
jgi:rod shape-determining protein MreC